jgi:hypothetical protein
LAAVVATAFFACKKKEEVVETAETAVVEAPPEVPVVATPDQAGAKPVETPAEVAKHQMLDGLAYTITVVGWDNPFAATMCGRVLDSLAVMMAAATTDEEKGTLAEVELELRAVKSKLDDVVAKGGTLTQEELDALKASLKEADAKLAGLYGFAPTRRLTEAEGDKLKEGYRLRKEKEKEGGDLRKEKLKEGGDELKRKKAEGEAEGK